MHDPTESRSWKWIVREGARQAVGNRPLIEGPVVLEVVFVYPPLRSWPKRRKLEIELGHEIPKATRPDLKNLMSAIEDGLAGTVFVDDNQVYSYGQSRKVYGARAEVRVRVICGDDHG